MARHCFVAIPVVGWAAVKKVLSLIACFIIGVSGLTACYVYARLNTPGRPLAAPARIFISPGSTLQQTAQMLVAEGILGRRSAISFLGAIHRERPLHTKWGVYPGNPADPAEIA